MLHRDSVVNKGGVFFFHATSEIFDFAEHGGEGDFLFLKARPINPDDTVDFVALEADE